MPPPRLERMCLRAMTLHCCVHGDVATPGPDAIKATVQTKFVGVPDGWTGPIWFCRQCFPVPLREVQDGYDPPLQSPNGYLPLRLPHRCESNEVFPSEIVVESGHGDASPAETAR